MIDCSAEGGVLGVEAVSASGGVDLSDIPFAPTVEQTIGASRHSINIHA